MKPEQHPEGSKESGHQPAKPRSLSRLSSNIDFLVVTVLLLLIPSALILARRSLSGSIDYWVCATWLYVALALVSFVPVWRAIRRKVEDEVRKKSLSKAQQTIADARPIDPLSDETKEAISLNFERLSGTLMFWKYEAEKYRLAHYYCLFWTIPSAVLIPILTQAAIGSAGGTTLVTVVSAFTAILLAFHKGLKIEENFRAFRHGESEFYDLFRRMLDRPTALGNEPKTQLEAYVIETETIRRFVRNAETNNMATLDEARQLLKGNEPKKNVESGA